MRRYKQEITDKSEINEIIEAAKAARLGLNRDGAPYIVPMNFGYADGVFYFHCAGEGLKLELLKADPRVCIEIDGSSELKKTSDDNPCSWGMDYKSVIATGTAALLSDFDEKKNGLELIINQLSDNAPPMPEQRIEAVTVFKVPVETMTAKKSD